MLRQRLLAAIVVREGRAVQSFGYQRWLPLGDVSCVVENLDRWGADGIVVLSTDRENKGPDLGILRRLSKLELSTPLSYGGGIHTAEHALEAVQAGAERLILDRALTMDENELSKIKAAVGRQALIASIPLRVKKDGCVDHYRYWCQSSYSLQRWIATNSWPEHVSEILVIDAKGEGSRRGINPQLIKALEPLGLPLLAFGGLDTAEHVGAVLKMPGVAAAVVGNSLNYKEQSIQKLKEQLTNLPLRPHPINRTSPQN